MGSISSVVAAITAPVVGFVKEVGKDIQRIEEAKAKQAAMPKLDDITEDEMQEILKRRAARNR